MNIVFVGYRHAHTASIYKDAMSNPEIHVLGGWEPTEVGRAMAEGTGLEFNYPTLEAVLADERVDAIMLGGVYGERGAQAIAALKAGKHVYGDKPICTTLEELRFTGDVPSIAENAFTDLWLTAYYPYRNDTWTEDKLLPYGGHLTWEPYCPDGGYPCDDGHHVPARDNSGDESGFCKWCGIPCRSSGSTVWAIEEDGTMYVYGNGEMYAHDSDWKKYADQVTALVVKEGVTGTIHGFDQFRNLESVSLPEGLACIEKGCFAGCTSLKQVNFPESLTEMGSNAFQNCVSLEEVRLPAGLKSFGARPFGGCTSLTGI
jgi:hypothetical protein